MSQSGKRPKRSSSPSPIVTIWCLVLLDGGVAYKLVTERPAAACVSATVKVNLTEVVRENLTERYPGSGMSTEYRNTLRSQAWALSSLGKAYTRLASKHRSAASTQERGRVKALTIDDFGDWLVELVEFSAAAERLLALEVELARSHGITWDEVALALGTTKQAAWDRFSSHSRWQKTRRISQLNRARRAKVLERLRNELGRTPEELSALEQWLSDARQRRSPEDGHRSS